MRDVSTSSDLLHSTAEQYQHTDGGEDIHRQRGAECAVDRCSSLRFRPWKYAIAHRQSFQSRVGLTGAGGIII